MKKGLRYIILLLLAFLSFKLPFAQVRVQASTDKDKILIGEQFNLLLEAYLPLGQQLKWPALDTFNHFDFINIMKIDTAQSIEGNKYSQVITLTAFDSGRRQIPQLEFVIAGQSYYTDTIGIEVAYNKFDPSEDYHDIKEIEEIVHPYAKYIPWIVLSIGVISIGALAYFLSLKRKVEVVVKAPPPIAPRISPYEEAMKAIRELKAKRLDEQGHIKEYYTEMNVILREFLQRRLNITTIERTNSELIPKLRERNMPAEIFSGLQQALMVSDYVKFAKQQPGAEDNKENMKVIENAIGLLNRTF